MEKSDQNTEQVILAAAEAEFLEKGFGNAKVVAIARRAGVSHSMLHYYYRSKEKLFQVVFESKVQKVSSMFEDIFKQQLPFEQTIRKFIETQFNFVAQNPKLPHFMMTEIINNKNNRAILFDVLSPKIKDILSQIQQRLDEQIACGAVRKIRVEDLIINIISINVFTFISMPILIDVIENDSQLEQIVADRRESNVQFILNSLRP